MKRVLDSPKLEQRASLLNNVSKRNGAFSIIVTSSAILDNDATKAFGCETCSTVFGSNLVEPFCPNCGGLHVKAKVAKLRAMPRDDKQLSAVVCSSCGAHNILDDRTALAMNGNIHCTSCGTDIKYPHTQLSDAAEDFDKLYDGEGNDVGPKPDADTITDADDADLDDIVQKKTPQKASNSASDGVDVGPQPDDKPITHADDKDIEDIVKKKEAQKAGDMGMGDGDDLIEPIEDDELEAGDGGSEGDGLDDGDVGGDAEIDFGEAEEVEPAMSQCSMLKVMSSVNGKKTFSIGYHGDDMLAFVNDVAVARLSKETAGDYEEVLSTASFGDAVMRMASTEGAKKTLAHFGFKEIQVAFPVSKLAQERINKRVEAKTKEMAKEIADLTADMQQCLSIAAVGLNKGFFRNHGNPIKAAFFEALTTAGVRKPELLIDKVFAAHGDAYHKSLFEIATDLRSKPLDVRNAMSETVGAVQYQKAEALDEDVEGEDVEGEGDDMTDGEELSTVLEASVARPSRISLVASTSKSGATQVRELARTATQGRGRLF